MGKIKKEEERAAINASASAPYKPWTYMASKLSGDELNSTFKDNSFEYYKGTVGGALCDRSVALKKYLKEDFNGTDAGFSSVTLEQVIRSSEESEYKNAAKTDTAGTVALEGQPLNKEDSTGNWDVRQSIFATKAWHAVRGWAPDSNRCIAISTKASINEMILPGVYAIFIPVFVGFLVGPSMLLGLLAGSIGAGAMMAIMMSNAGGAWDNSKKYIEIAGAHGGKGTEIHKSCVVGDTVGDPFKDTSGPALNILLKLMAVVSLTIATLLRGQDDWELWYYAFIPFVIMAVATFLVIYFNYMARTDEVKPDEEEPAPVAPVVKAQPEPEPEPVVPTPPPVVETPLPEEDDSAKAQM